MSTVSPKYELPALTYNAYLFVNVTPPPAVGAF
jgi:hypothetical protein